MIYKVDTGVGIGGGRDIKNIESGWDTQSGRIVRRVKTGQVDNHCPKSNMSSVRPSPPTP